MDFWNLTKLTQNLWSETRQRRPYKMQFCLTTIRMQISAIVSPFLVSELPFVTTKAAVSTSTSAVSVKQRRDVFASASVQYGACIFRHHLLRLLFAEAPCKSRRSSLAAIQQNKCGSKCEARWRKVPVLKSVCSWRLKTSVSCKVCTHFQRALFLERK
jgi:hypothetical protein